MPDIPAPVNTPETALEEQGPAIGALLREAIALHQGCEYDRARALYEDILALSPGNADAHHNLGVLLTIQMLRPDEGLPHLETALSGKPDNPQFWFSYLDALLRTEQPALVLQLIPVAEASGLPRALGNALRERASANEPVAEVVSGDVPEAEQHELAALFGRRDFHAAEARARTLLERYPASGFLWKALGASLQSLGRKQEALEAKARAVALRPHDAEAHGNLGRAYFELGQTHQAIELLQTAVAIRPDYAEAHNNLGLALNTAGRVSDAHRSFVRAVELQPRFAEALNNLSGIHTAQGEVEAAIEVLQRAVDAKPDYQIAYDNLLFLLNYHPDLSAEAIYGYYERYEERFGVPQRGKWRAHGNAREAGRRLKVGYVSPDFRGHACTFFLEPLLANHDRSAVEIYAYAELREAADAATARYRGYADHWVETRELSDDALAERIRADGIDILVDLAGHTKGNRLGVFARKPAPVSISWMGFGYTTGLKAIDWYLTDEASAPAGSEHLFSERPWRLPGMPYAAYRPAAGMGEVNALPALSRGHVTLGTLTRGVRLNHRTVRVWAQILKRLPDAHLVVDSRSFQDEGLAAGLVRRFEAQGIDARRLHVGFHSPPWDVLRNIDIGLDCFPHNSGTTLFETLYMGIPFVTLAQRPSVGRIGSAILQGLGKPEWIARTEEEYIEKVVALASDVTGLALQRAMLRPQMQVSALMDEVGFARGVEAAYREMFGQWAAANPAPDAMPAPLPDEQAELLYNLGNRHHDEHRLAEAEACFREALARFPDYPEAANNLGLVLQEQGRLADAAACYRTALAIRPGYALAHHNLGNALQHGGELVEAIDCYIRALDLGLDSGHFYDNLLFLLNYHPDLSAEAIYGYYERYEERFGVPQRGKWRAHGNAREAGRRLKVGYVSPDFRGHACTFFLEPLLANHDRSAVEIYAYAELREAADAATARYRGYADHWVETRELSDDALAERIRADGIDILVDLAGHTKGNRLGVFARKPAPVSISWMGFGYTTGLKAIDWYLTDEASAPAGSEHLFSERPWRLPGMPYAAYRPAAGMGEVNALPALSRGHVTLGTLTRGVRLNHRTVRVWAQILKRLPDAHLVVDSRSFQDEGLAAGLVRRFEAQGIDARRLHVGFHSPPWDVLRNIDIGLDCFPHNSGTTLFETLYMGIPFVTLAQRPSVGRIGSAILQGLGKPEWIARTEEEYIEKVVALASDVTGLALQRAMLRPQMQVSALMDEVGFARGVEAAYREMFGQWAAANPAPDAMPAPQSRPTARKRAGAAARASGPTQAELDQLVRLFRERRFEEGEQRARDLVRRFPRLGFAWKALGVMLQSRGRSEEVLAVKRRAAELLPQDAEAQCNLGHVLQDQGHFEEAEQVLLRALKLKPDYVEAYNNLAITYQKQGRLEASVAHFEQALRLDPGHEDIYSNMLFTLNYHPDLEAPAIYAAYREYDRRFGLPCRAVWQAHANAPLDGRRLKIGYVSPDFRNHACCRFLEPLLERHDKRAVEVYAYAELAREDDATRRYKGYVDHWVATRGLSDDALAARIRSDGIDVLVDVAGHTVGNRLGVFARKPAPVSVSWLGFGYTSGLTAIDHFLTDEASAPPGSEPLFAENLWRLPVGWAYRPAPGMGEVGGLPAHRNGHITLGTLTRSVRINHHTVAVWSDILRRLPHARLVIDSASFVDEAAQRALRQRFEAHGIAGQRLVIGYHSPPWDVLREIDIGLDCFPHNSGTTLFESLYMGVPYVTLAGRPSVGRLGSSILTGLGHPEWIADSHEAYADRVVALASDLDGLAQLRRTLRQRMLASALMDESGFARQVENAFRQMFTHWSQGDPHPLRQRAHQARLAYEAGNTHHEQGRTEQALAEYQRAIDLFPEFNEAHSNLALVLHETGQLEAAEAAYRQVVVLDPASATSHYNLGANLKAQGRLSEAEACFRQAVALWPDFPQAVRHLDIVLQEMGRWTESETHWRQQLQARPEDVSSYVQLSGVLRQQNRNEEALGCLQQALRIEPGRLAVELLTGTLLKDMGRLDAAERQARKTVEQHPDDAPAWSLLGDVLSARQQLVEAEAAYRKALALTPDLASVHGNLGIVLQNQGRLLEAEMSMRRALEINPQDVAAHGNLLFVLNYHPDKTGDEVFAEYRAYDQKFLAGFRREWREHTNLRDPARRLKVGYVSPDFRNHSCANFLEPLLEHHDKSAVEVYAYAELWREDAATARYKRYVDHWIPTRGMSDAVLAERIRADGIDILVDLAGHTGGNRLGVFARKPAPVSLSWMGYGYTTGLSAIDYFLTDEASAPPGSERFFSEQPWRLPVGWAYRPAGRDQMGEVGASPAARNGYVTFGTLTRAIRVNHRTVRVWAELLRRVKDARLVIDSRSYLDAQTQEELAQRFVDLGVERERLLIGCHSPPWDVLRGIDIGLDCFPHNSGTTLFETLYMGIPFVSLADRPSVGCLGSSILQGLGRPEWIARSEAEYIDKAAALAADHQALSALRAGLRQAMQASILMDEAGFAREVEQAYRQMFKRWCERDKA